MLVQETYYGEDTCGVDNIIVTTIIVIIIIIIKIWHNSQISSPNMLSFT
jgi:hypothetical protein